MMTTPLVRARRLVFVQTCPIGREFVAKTQFGDYIIEQTTGDEWQASLNGEYVGYAECQRSQVESACQSDFDARVMADIEVLPLVWTLLADDPYASVGNENYFIYGLPSGFKWFLGGDDAPPAILCDTLNEAKAACNAHNRKTILGK